MAFWSKKIINSNENLLSLDISDSSIKVFQLERSGSVDRVRSFGIKEIPPGYVDNGKIINQEKVIEAIKELLSKTGPRKINTQKVICSLPESKVFLHAVTIPTMSEEEAAEAVKWEIEASIPLSVDQVYYDWQFLDKKDGKQNVLTASVAKDFSDELCDILEKCGLEVCCLEMESIAIARSLISQEAKREDVYLIADIGSVKTSFIVTEGNVPYFTSSIPFSSSAITDEISNQLSLAKKEADQLKINEGIDSSNENNSILNSLNPLLESLAIEIEKTIDFYQSMPNHSSKSFKIMLVGGGSNFKGLLGYLKSKLSWDVSIGDPWVNLKLDKKLPVINQANSVRFAVSIGLAMRGANYGNKT